MSVSLWFKVKSELGFQFNSYETLQVAAYQNDMKKWFILSGSSPRNLHLSQNSYFKFYSNSLYVYIVYITM